MTPTAIPVIITFLFFMLSAIIGTNKGELTSATEVMTIVSESTLNIFANTIDNTKEQKITNAIYIIILIPAL